MVSFNGDTCRASGILRPQARAHSYSLGFGAYFRKNCRFLSQKRNFAYYFLCRPAAALAWSALTLRPCLWRRHWLTLTGRWTGFLTYR